METTNIRATKQLTNRLKSVAEVRGKNESMATVIDSMLTSEMINYANTQDGLVKIGDVIQIANKDRELTDDILTVHFIDDEVLFTDGSAIAKNTRSIYFSKIVKRS